MTGVASTNQGPPGISGNHLKLEEAGRVLQREHDLANTLTSHC